MYPVSTAYTQAIRGRSRQITWYGTITLTDGTVHDFDLSNIVGGSAALTRQCASSSLDLGGVYASELVMSLRLDIDRYLLSKAVISLRSRLIYQDEVETWGDSLTFSWDDMASTTWRANPKRLYYDVPMGLFTVSEAIRIANVVKITAYDYMLKFEQKYSPDDVRRTVYDWLTLWCTDCGVQLASSRTQTMSLINGNRLLNLSIDKGDSISYRTALSYLATACCSIATINREGGLELIPYHYDVDDVLSTEDRYSSRLAESKVYYTEIYATYKKSQSVEHYTNTYYTGENDGLAYNVGVNPFLQITDSAHRQAALRLIINKLSEIQFTAFESKVPCHPEYDLLDVIQFTGGRAGTQDFGAITSIVFKINDGATISCAGENQDLIGVSSDNQQEIQYISDNTNINGIGGTNVWILFDDSANVSAVSSEPQTVNDILYQQSTDVQKLVIAYTGEYTLSADDEVSVIVLIDETGIHIASDNQKAGKHSFSFTVPYLAEGTGSHEISIQMKTATENIQLASSKLSVVGVGYNNNVSYDSGLGDYDFDYIQDLIDQGIITDFDLNPLPGFGDDLELADTWSELLPDMELELPLDDGTSITIPGLDITDVIQFEPDAIDWENDPMSDVDFMGLDGIISPGIMNIDPSSNLFVDEETLRDLRNLDNWYQNRPAHFTTSYNQDTNTNTILVSGHSPNCGTWWEAQVPNLDPSKRYGFTIRARAVTVASFPCRMTVNGHSVSYTISGGCQVLLPEGATNATIHVQPDAMIEWSGKFSVYNLAFEVVSEKDRHYYDELT